MRAIIDSLRRHRHERGLSQHEVARVMGTTQSAVARLEGGHVDPKLSTIAAYAAAVGHALEVATPNPTTACADTARDAVARGDHDGALRAVIELFDGLLRSPDPAAELRVEPAPTGSPEWDAAIAAACERAAHLRGVPVPGWTAAPSRRLDRAWFAVEAVIGRSSAGLQCLALATSPPEFAVRGVFIDADTAGKRMTPPTTTLFDRDDVERLLREVADELAARDVRGWLFVVRGAAMALAYGRHRLTRDVDAVFEPKEVVYEAARVVARRHGLPDDWLNDGVKGFLHGQDPNATTHLDQPGLVVQVASPQYLFTMKALAARVDRDASDLLTLYRLCGFADVEEALDHVDRTAPSRLLTPKTSFLLRELLSEDDGALPTPGPSTGQPAPPGTGRPTTAMCGHPLPRGGTCTERPGHRGRHRRR